MVTSWATASATPTGTFRPSCEYISKQRVIFIFIGMMDQNMTIVGDLELDLGKEKQNNGYHIPLQIIGPGVLMVPIGTEWADVDRRVVDNSMPYQVILSLKPLAAFRMGTVGC